MDEAQYRGLIKETLDRVEKAFDQVDPDVVECASQFGALGLTFTKTGGQKCILSSQPSVRQLWMAVAAKGIAFHFNYDAQSQTWRDDKDGSVEFFPYLTKLIEEHVGLKLKF